MEQIRGQDPHHDPQQQHQQHEKLCKNEHPHHHHNHHKHHNPHHHRQGGYTDSNHEGECNKDHYQQHYHHHQQQHHHQTRQQQQQPQAPPQTYPALDGGWGYLVAVAAFSVAFMLDGTENSYGLLLPHVIASFGGHVALASLCGGLVTGVILGAGPLAAFLVRRFGCRRVSFVGSIVASASVVMATLARRIEVFVLFYGLFAGFGMGLVYLPSITMINAYFDRKRGLFAGVVTSGSGIGLLVISLLTDLLITEYGWRGCYLVIAGILLNLCVCSSLMRPLADNYRSGSRTRTTGFSSSSSSLSSPCTEDSLKDVRDDNTKMSRNVATPDGEDISKWVASQPLLPSQHTSGELTHQSHIIPRGLGQKTSVVPKFISLQKLTQQDIGIGTLEKCESKAIEIKVERIDTSKNDVNTYDNTSQANATDHLPTQDSTLNNKCQKCSDTATCDSDTEQRVPSQSNGALPHQSIPHPYHRLYEPNNHHQDNHHNHLHHLRRHHPHDHPHHQLHEKLCYRDSHSSLHDATDTESNISGRPPLQKSDLLNILPEFLGSMSSLSVHSVHNVGHSRGSLHSLRSSVLHQRAGGYHVTGPHGPHATVSQGSKHSLSGRSTLEDEEMEEVELEQAVEYSSCDLFKIVRFDLFCVGAFLVQMAAIIPTMFVPSYVVSAGLSAATAATIVSILGISNTAGRLSAGILSYLGLGAVRVYNCGTCLAGLACFLLPFCSTFPSLVAFAIGHGFFIGFYPPLQSVILVEQLGLDRLPASFGIMCVCKSMASVSGPFFAGALYEWARSYAVPFYLAGATMMLANIVHCVMAFCPKPQGVGS